MTRSRLLGAAFFALHAIAGHAADAIDPATGGTSEPLQPLATPPAATLTDPVANAAALPRTLELVGAHGFLTGGQPNAKAANLRGTWDRGNGDTVRAELLDETKFGSHGGLVAGSYTAVLDPDWLLAGALAFGHGGPNWANQRVDLELTTKWFEARNVLSRVAVYHARYDQGRTDSGVRLSMIGYLPNGFVVEGGVLGNVSQPGRVDSGQAFGSVTWGAAGRQYLSARVSTGTEAYQAIGDGRQLVGFHSTSVGASWRRWIARSYGFVVGVEHYRNPSYQRTTAAAGVFVQW